MNTTSIYNAKRIAWELERTALGDGYYGNALRVAKDIPGVTDDDRALLDKWATGRQESTDHVALQDLALRIYPSPWSDIELHVPAVKRPVKWPTAAEREYNHLPDSVIDATELSLCVEYADLSGDGTYVEAVDGATPAESVEKARAILQDPEQHAIRSFWTVYGHCPEGGVRALADTDYEAAARLAAALEVCVLLKAGKPDHPQLSRLVSIALDPH